MIDIIRITISRRWNNQALTFYGKRIKAINTLFTLGYTTWNMYLHTIWKKNILITMCKHSSMIWVAKKPLVKMDKLVNSAILKIKNCIKFKHRNSCFESEFDLTAV